MNTLLDIHIATLKTQPTLIEFSGMDFISQPFCYELTIIASKQSILMEKIIGSNVTVSLNQFNKTQYFNGIIKSFCLQHSIDATQARYQLQMVPWLWFLKQSSDCRIFQNLSVVEIVTQVFTDLGFRELDTSHLLEKYAQREFTVQYNETHYAFIKRLLAEAGISYYFAHTADKHQLVLVDNNHDFKQHLGPLPSEYVSHWQQVYAIHNDNISSKDYHYLTPQTNLLSQAPGKISSLEHYYYPGNFDNLAAGQKVITQQQQRTQLKQECVYVNSSCFGLQAGLIIKPQGKDSYLIQRIEHRAQDYGRFPQCGDKPAQRYENNLACVLASHPYRPALEPSPIIHGLHSAIVVGPVGDTVYTDTLGRIKVQFHWDREGHFNSNSSCWLRVGQHGGTRDFGQHFLPRIGQEVLVYFRNGNPDQPEIIGTVYNGDHALPFITDNDTMRSGIRTRSLGQNNHTRYNELSFNDQKQQEQIYCRAQHNLQQSVQHDLVENIGHNAVLRIEKGAQLHEILNGTCTITASEVQLQVGASRITLNAAGIHFDSPQLVIGGDGALQASARVGDFHQCPDVTPAGLPHQGGAIKAGSSNVFVNGKAAARVSDTAQCKHAQDELSTGSEVVFINGKAAVRVNDAAKHGGKITEGSGDVQFG